VAKQPVSGENKLNRGINQPASCRTLIFTHTRMISGTCSEHSNFPALNLNQHCYHYSPPFHFPQTVATLNTAFQNPKMPAATAYVIA
jgi:hypothetical protein